MNLRTTTPDTLFYVALLVLLFFVIALTGCDIDRGGEEQAGEEVSQNIDEAQARHGTAQISNYQEYALAKRIQELRDREDLTTYTYTINRDGERRLYCESIGYGLPYGAQTTNPMKREHGNHGAVAIPQAEPNTLYLPSDVDATWINCVNDDGTTSVRYVEQRITVSPDRLDTP